MIAKQWRENKPKLAKKGNISIYTELIENKRDQSEMLIRLNNSAKRQMKFLKDILVSSR